MPADLLAPATAAPATAERNMNLNALALVASTLTTGILGLAFWSVAARLFPAAEVGVASALITSAVMLSTLSIIGIDVLYERFLPLAGVRATQLLRRGFLLVAGVALAAGALLVAFGPRDALFDSGWEMVGYPILVAVLALFALQDKASAGLGVARWAALKNLVHAAAKLAAIVALAMWSTALTIVAAWALTALVAGAWAFAALYRRAGSHPRYRRAPDLPGTRDLWSYFGSSFGITALWSIGPLVAPLIVITQVDAEANAHFAVAWAIVSALLLATHLITSPYVAEVAAHPDQVRALSRRMAATVAVFTVAASAGLVVFGPMLLSIAGPEYREEGLGLLHLAAAFLPLAAVSTVYEAFARVRRRLRLYLVLQAFSAVVVVTVAWATTADLGLTGIGWAYLSAQAVEAAVLIGPVMSWLRRGGPTAPEDAARLPLGETEAPTEPDAASHDHPAVSTELQCRLCGSSRLRSVVDLGATPPCESFLTAADLDAPEPTYPLHLRVCQDCLLLQLPALITPENTFTEYAYFSSYSDSWVQHSRRFVEEAAERLDLGSESMVVEVASNDGYLLQHVVARGIPCLGIEPSVNVGAAARAKDVPTMTAFLDEKVAADVRSLAGPADLVIANNVYAHIPDLLGFTRALRILLDDDGWLSIEVHHALNLVREGQFDTIYHEHFQYYTVLTAIRALATADLTVVDVEMIPTHGGSIRLWARPAVSDGVPSPRVAEVLEVEADAGLHDIAGYEQVQRRAETIRHDLLQFLLDCRSDGKRVVGYGAPGKATTLLNYCGIRPDLLEYTVDRNPYKHGRFIAGARIPILDPAQIAKDQPDFVLMLPWNLKEELTSQLAYIGEWGGRLLVPMPNMHFADSENFTSDWEQGR